MKCPECGTDMAYGWGISHGLSRSEIERVQPLIKKARAGELPIRYHQCPKCKHVVSHTTQLMRKTNAYLEMSNLMTDGVFWWNASVIARVASYITSRIELGDWTGVM